MIPNVNIKVGEVKVSTMIDTRGVAWSPFDLPENMPMMNPFSWELSGEWEDGWHINHSIFRVENNVVKEAYSLTELDKNKNQYLGSPFKLNKEQKELKNGLYLIKSDNKDYSLTKEREDGINSLEINNEQKEFLKNLFKEEPTPKPSDLLVEVVGQNPFLFIKSIKNNDTGEDITNRFVITDGDDVNTLWTLTKNLEWILQ